VIRPPPLPDRRKISWVVFHTWLLQSRLCPTDAAFLSGWLSPHHIALLDSQISHNLAGCVGQILLSNQRHCAPSIPSGFPVLLPIVLRKWTTNLVCLAAHLLSNQTSVWIMAFTPKGFGLGIFRTMLDRYFAFFLAFCPPVWLPGHRAAYLQRRFDLCSIGFSTHRMHSAVCFAFPLTHGTCDLSGSSFPSTQRHPLVADARFLQQ